MGQLPAENKTAVSEQDFEEFRCEALELLEIAEKSLLEIDSGADFKVTFDSVFRCFHNLKGASGMMELTALQAHTHELENTLLKFKEGTCIPKEYVTHFLSGLDRARELLGNAADSARSESEATQPELTQEPEVHVAAQNDPSTGEFFQECDEIVERVGNVLRKLEAGEYEPELIDSFYRDFHSLKGNSYLFNFKRLGNIAHLVETSLEPLRESKTCPSKELIDQTFSALLLIEKEIRSIKGLDPVEPKAATESSPTVLASTVAAKPALSVTASATPSVGSKDKEPESSSVRVSVNLLDNLMTLMGEMVLVRNQVLQISNESDDLEFSNLGKRLHAVTSELQDGMMKTRMQPIGNVLNKFSRVVRDLSLELGKKISIEVTGAETELDKSLLEAIKDPLTHIVRNSCDHGIELPEVRKEAGKSADGKISIRAFHEGGQVVIEVRDDGKGLNPAVLTRKAIEKGLITETQSQSMSEQEAFSLIFAPGFSTAKSVTNVSGRGVGMDVVRTNIEKIGGTVELKSTVGQGTTILMKIPLTLAIVPALVVNHGGGIFAIPQVKLLELVRVDQSCAESRVEYLHEAPVYRLRGDLLPLVDLNQVLAVSKDPKVAATSILNIAVLNADGRSFGLILDEVRDTADIVVKPLNQILKSLQIYSGATILGDGSIALILDVQGLSKFAQIGTSQASDRDRSREGSQGSAQRSEEQDYILVKLGSPTKHAIVLNYVHRLEEFSRTDIEYDGDQRVIRYRDSLLHLVSANQALGYPVRVSSEKEMIPIVVVERSGILFGIEVDEILDTLRTSVDPEPSLVQKLGTFGSLNTPDELITMIDPFELISLTYGKAESKVPLLEGLPPRALKILLAEDTVFFKKAISLVLSKAGHQVVAAADGQEALELFNQDPSQFDLIVSDIEMPRLNGFGFAKAVRANKTHATVPMLAVSSRNDASYRTKGLEAGFNVYLEKLKPDLLVKTVNELAAADRKVA